MVEQAADEDGTQKKQACDGVQAISSGRERKVVWGSDPVDLVGSEPQTNLRSWLGYEVPGKPSSGCDNSASEPSGVFGLKNPLWPAQPPPGGGGRLGLHPMGVGILVISSIDPNTSRIGVSQDFLALVIRKPFSKYRLSF
jgi:hypothetical protein